MDILNKFGFDASLFDGVSDTTLFEGSGTTTLTLGKRVPYTATINGMSVPAYVTFNGGSLTRMSLLQQQQVSSGKDYWLATMIFNKVKFDIDLMIDGKTMSLVDFLHHVAQQASGKTIDRDEFNLIARRIGFNFDEGMPLFVQQFGASFDGFKNAVDAFKAAGAEDALKSIAAEKRGRIKAAYSHQGGVPITQFELGSVDRAKSPRNQGFQNLVDAQIEQFTRIVGLRKQARVLRSEIENAKGWSQDKIKTAQAKVDELNKLSRQWVSSWSGAQQRIVNNGGIYTPENQYDPVNAPCGRFTMVIGGNEIPVDLWTNSARANNPVAVTSTVADDDDPI